MRKRRWLKIALAALLVPLILAGAGLAWIAHDLPPLDDLTHRAAFASTRILDRNGALLYELFDPQGGQRTLVPLAAIPTALRDATLAAEAADF